ncbi:hypothetical protein E5673_14255 [Sphingomonas sp. PAMC26645]|uniref:hypothetical protein n=1 Tax=Sphingomonas sp. PAMC26645 TaxID=2565555 RepID=UPI00109DBC08|nr:hypothetical protein [Sphingomonas sp. PAMC26645]QCB43243.1 hypothetical protein E5673_14255 [Sphingomonas sp. PAMC26645]
MDAVDHVSDATRGTIALAIGSSATGPELPGPVDERLVDIFGSCVPRDEVAIWTDMPPARRAKALQRIGALDRYCTGEEGLTAKKAAADAGVKLGRFYQMARAWPNERSLRTLGTYAVATQSRERFKPEVVAAIQAVVTDVVRFNEGVSVARLVQVLAERSGLPAENLPKKNTLRVFVERELRRVREVKQAGHEILFDCCATSMRRADGRRHDIFVIIDAGTRLILGLAVGDTTNSAAGYAEAARDALHRVAEDAFPGSIWATRIERSQLVPGEDSDQIRIVAAKLVAAIGRGVPQVVGQGTYGRYIREHIGLKLDAIQMLPGRTGKGREEASPAKLGLSEIDARARLEVPLAAHNALVWAELAVVGEPQAPGEFVTLLELLGNQL